MLHFVLFAYCPLDIYVLIQNPQDKWYGTLSDYTIHTAIVPKQGPAQGWCDIAKLNRICQIEK